MIEVAIACLFFLALFYGGDVIALVRERQRLKHGLAPTAAEPDAEAYDRADFAGDCAYTALEKGYGVTINPMEGDRAVVAVFHGATTVAALSVNGVDDGWGEALHQIKALPARSGGSA